MGSERLLFEAASPETAMVAATLYVILLLAGTMTAIILVVRSLRHPVAWAPHVRWMCSRPWTWREGLGITATVGALILMTMGIAAALHKPDETTLVITQSILLDLAGIAAIAIVIVKRRWGWRDAFGMAGSPVPVFRHSLLFYIALMPFLFISSLVYQGILVVNGYPPSLQEIALLLSADHPLWIRIYMTFLAIALAPFFEECLFRGILLPLLMRRMGPGTGIFLTSVLFSAIHFHVPSFIPLVVVASGFSIAYLYSRTLWVPIVMHGLFNGVNLALLLALRN